MLFYRYRKNQRLKRLHQIHLHKVNRMKQHEKRHLLKIKSRHPRQTDKLRRWNEWHLYHHISVFFNSKSARYDHSKSQARLLSIREQLKRASNEEARRRILTRYNQKIINRRKLRAIFREKEIREERLRQSRLPMVVPQPRSDTGKTAPSSSRDGIGKSALVREIHHINQTLSRLERETETDHQRPVRQAHRPKQPLVIKPHQRARTDPIRQLAASGGQRPRSWISMLVHGFQLVNGMIWFVLTLILVFIVYLVISR